MGICWWCHWGWPVEIRDIYESAVEKLDGFEDPLHWGPSHIVWEDENFDCAQYCLDNFEKNKRDYSDEQLSVVRESLELLLALPDEFKNEPEGYDEDSKPEDFPPPANWKMVR